jgi:hypothetical protein
MELFLSDYKIGQWEVQNYLNHVSYNVYSDIIFYKLWVYCIATVEGIYCGYTY